MPYAGKAAIAAMECITRFEEETVHVCSLYNTWYTVLNLIGNMRRYGDEAVQKEADDIVKTLLLRAPEAIRASTKKISEFQKPDGSFSYEQHRSSPTTQGVPVSRGEWEGDVNGLACAMHYPLGSIFGVLGIKKIPMCNYDDYLGFVEKIKAAHEKFDNK